MSTFYDTTNTGDSSGDEDVDADEVMLMEKIVAARIEQHEADRRLAEQLHAQQLKDQIQQLQAQLRYQESMATASTIRELPHQESQRPVLFNNTTTGTFAPNLTFFNGQTSSSVLAEQESLMVLGKAVAQRARQQAQNQQEESCTQVNNSETSKESSELPQCSKKQLQYYPTKPNQLSLQHPERLSEDIQRMTNTPALARQGRLSYPGAIRVGNNTEDDEDDNLQYQVSRVVLENNTNADEPIIAGIHTDLEQAQVRQEIIQQAPQVDVVAVKDAGDDLPQECASGDHNFKMRRLVAPLMVLVTVGIGIVITMLLRGSNSPPPPFEQTYPPTFSPTVATTCPCAFDTSTFQTSEMDEPFGMDVPFAMCGRYEGYQEALSAGYFGAGICQGLSCVRFITNVGVDVNARGCFMYRKGMDGNLDLSTNDASYSFLLQNQAQEDDCKSRLAAKCVEENW